RNARLLELAELFRQHGGQVAQAPAAADGDRDLALRRSGAGDEGQRQQPAREPAQNGCHGVLPFVGGTIMRRSALEKATLVRSAAARKPPAAALFRLHGVKFFVAPCDGLMASGGLEA